MIAKRLLKDGTIGVFCPSHIANMERYAPIIAAIERLGFNIKIGANVHKDTYGYAASAEERAADLNALVADDSVQMVLFSGGESAAEILPLIDYDNIRRNPKLFSNYSDGTSILNAIYAQTGLVTYYGIGVSDFADLRHYDYMQFCAHFVDGYSAEKFVNDSKWITLRGGICEGTLIGGYTPLFALMLANQYFKYDSNKKYLIFLENLEKAASVGTIATMLAFIGQSAFMRNVAGLIFGHYSVNVPEAFLRCLERFGEKYNIPVVYTDDFGHGTRHAILPIGVTARLDADNQSMIFLYD
jgi:muramoyltetrapeptide carboxypeptidase